MVKKKRKELGRLVKAKLALEGKTIADFCRELGISYELYKRFIEGKVNGKRAGETKVKRLMKAIETLLEKDLRKAA